MQNFKENRCKCIFFFWKNYPGLQVYQKKDSFTVVLLEVLRHFQSRHSTNHLRTVASVIVKLELLGLFQKDNSQHPIAKIFTAAVYDCCNRHLMDNVQQNIAPWADGLRNFNETEVFDELGFNINCAGLNIL